MTPASVLVVEDDRIVSRDIQLQLSQAGYIVVGSAATGQDAMRLVEQHKPDVVLMDIRLDGSLDGIQSASSIRSRYRIPVIFLTAYADDETIKRASRAEPFGYLLKPFEEGQLRTTIEMALYKHEAEKKLRESERRYATTLASIGDAVIATDAGARVTFMNPAAEGLTRWPVGEAVGRPVTDVFRIVNQDTRLPVEDPVAKVLRLGTTAGLANHTILIGRDGHETPIDDCGSPIVDDDGDISGCVLVFRDISHQKQANDALKQAQSNLALAVRLTRLGELAAAIAHEIDQPLAAIVSNAEACVLYLEQAKEAAARVASSGLRAGEVVKSIRSLVGKVPGELVDVDLNQMVLEVVDLLRGEIRGRGVTIDLDLAAYVPSARGDRVQLQQVVFNLLMNGLEAMSCVEDREKKISLRSRVASGSGIEVSVSDTGVGFGQIDPDRMFQPMVSTKPDGMGLGLAICRSIVETHGGRIWAAETLNPLGASFTFFIPESDG